MFIRGLWGYLPANIIQGVVGVLLLVSLTNLLTPTEYGQYALAFSIMTLAHVAGFSWIEAAMARFRPARQSPQHLADLYVTLYRSLVIACAICAPVAAIALMASPMSPNMRWVVAIALCGIPARSAFKMVKEAYRARGAVKQTARLEIWLTIAGFAFTLAALMWGAGASAPMIGTLVAPLLALPFVLPKELRTSRGGHFRMPQLKSALTYGYPISIALGMSLIIAATDRFMLAYFIDEAAVGAYHASYSIANRTLDILFIWLGTAGVPALTMALEHGGAKGLFEVAKDKARIMLLITMPAAVGVALVAKPLADIVIGPDLRQSAASVTPLISVASFLAGLLYYYFNQAFAIYKRTDLLLLCMSITAAANVVFNALLIPRFGIMGAAVATVASFTLAIAVSVVLARGKADLPFPLVTFAQCAICCAIMAAVVHLMPSYGGWLELALDASVGVFVYGLCAFALNAGDVRTLIRKIAGAFRASEETLDA